MRKHILILFVFMSFVSFGQNIRISGVVTEENTGESIPGASVVVKGTQTGTVTDFDGNFSIEAEQGDVLHVTFMGMSDVEVTVGVSAIINIAMMPDIAQLDDIVVVGYGIQKKSSVTAAISSVSSKEISKLSVGLTSQALQGQTAGVTVLPSSGSPGSAAKIRIRGAGSNGNSDPIYIVDGMRTGNIDFLDPSDIESMEILKDAASAAIYGAEAGNGVVMISTKKGKNGDVAVSYNTQYGIQSMRNRTYMMNADQYTRWMKEIDPIDDYPKLEDWKGKEGTDWIGEIAQIAPMQRHNIQVSGGSDKSTFLLSGNFFTQDGIIGGEATNFNRTTIRLNSNHKVNKYLEIGNNFSYSANSKRGFREDDSYNGIINHAMMMDPTTPVVYEKGSIPTHVQDLIDNGKIILKDKEGRYYGVSKYITGEIANPVGQISATNRVEKQSKFIGNVYANIKPVKGLVMTTRLGVEQTFGKLEDWERKYYWTAQRENTTNSKTFNRNEYSSWLWENFATYSKSIGKNNISAMMGMSSQDNVYEYLDTRVTGMVKETEVFTQVGESQVDGKISGNKYPVSMYSYFGRLTYDYDNKYLLQLSLRNDNSSLFAEDKRAGYFPAVSTGWVVSQESFWNIETVNFLKVRASWGQNGSTANVRAGQPLALITKDGLKYPDITGNYLTVGELRSLPNENLTWETSEQLDLGFDLRAFNGKLSLGFDYYKKVTKGLLSPSSPPLHLGFDAPSANTGDITNKGIEIELGWRDEVGDFKYGANFNMTTLSNEVTYLNPLLDRVTGAILPSLNNITYFEEGLPVWYYRGYVTDGIFQNKEEVDNYLSKLGNVSTYSPVPGDPIIKDVNGDGDITNEDMDYIGDPHPSLILASTFDVAYKGFDARVFIQGAFGQENFMATSRVDRATTNRPLYFFEDRWTGEGSTNSFPRAISDSEYMYKSDLMVQDGSYLKIRQIQLGYNFTKELVQKLKIQNLRIYVSLDDYFTFTKYKGMDPEIGSFSNDSQGIDRGFYPVPSKIIMGLNVTF